MVGSIHIPDPDALLEGAEDPNRFNTIEIPDLTDTLTEPVALPQQDGQQQQPQLQQIVIPQEESIVIPEPEEAGEDGYGMQPMNFRLGTTAVPNNSSNDNSVPSTPISQVGLGLSTKNSDSQQQHQLQAKAQLQIQAQMQRRATLKRNNPPSYTLNIMVRQFTKYAERKLSLCLNSVPLDQEPNIIDLLSEGVDPTFDKIIASLGYIARRKPRRVTDAVMHWRRGKSELREMARSMLEKEILLQKDHKSKRITSTSSMQSNKNVNNNNGVGL
ncbi:unnamed protein product [Ambrosiozyma monospora]|uniref:Unnamed protein product n=1 Tax=Ambrosiozyma monospora TaxID=43982 RepID=A0ACB5SYB4_AMBMO|nr:unnamed protein product [Ambrosiozyma monospora]